MSAVAVVCVSRAAFAAPSREEAARDLYDRATAAHLRGEYRKAALDFAAADATVASPVALQAALDDAVLADDAALGMELVDRASRPPTAPGAPMTPEEAALEASVRAARTRFVGRTGRVSVRCPPPTCAALLDGLPFDARGPRYVVVGPHVITFRRGTEGKESRDQHVEVRADTLADVAPLTEPGAAPAAERAEVPGAALAATPAATNGASPAWFYAGLAATAVGGVASLVSGLDTVAKHRRFEDAGCSRAPAASCDRLSDDGASAQRRTNVLLAATAVSGVATAVVGAFFVQWRPARASVSGDRGTAATSPSPRPTTRSISIIESIAIGLRDGAPIAELRMRF